MKSKEGGCCQNRNGRYGSCEQEFDGVPASQPDDHYDHCAGNGIRIGMLMLYDDALEKKNFFFG